MESTILCVADDHNGELIDCSVVEFESTSNFTEQEQAEAIWKV